MSHFKKTSKVVAILFLLRMQTKEFQIVCEKYVCTSTYLNQVPNVLLTLVMITPLYSSNSQHTVYTNIRPLTNISTVVFGQNTQYIFRKYGCRNARPHLKINLDRVCGNISHVITDWPRDNHMVSPCCISSCWNIYN